MDAQRHRGFGAYVGAAVIIASVVAVTSTNGQNGELNAFRTWSARVISVPSSFFSSPKRTAKCVRRLRLALHRASALAHREVIEPHA